MAVLGDDDGKYYDLAKKLESQGIWRTWLGDSLYSNFSPSLSSPSAWASFMSSSSNDDDDDVDDSRSKSKSKSTKSKAEIQLQLRVRALLFDKAASLPNLTSTDLELHGDDVYFTLEDGVPNRDTKVQSQRFKQEDFPETWYHQFIEKYRASRPYMSLSASRELEKRNPSGMSNYMKLMERHKRRRVDIREDENGGFGISNSASRMQIDATMDDDTVSNDASCFFPETMFAMNCVPDCAVAPRLSSDEKQKVEFYGVLDTLPKMVTKSSSSIMLERLGIRPEYLSGEQGPGQSHTKAGIEANKKQLGSEQAMQMSKKVVARYLTTVGFEGTTEIPIQVLSQFLSCHISKLGNILKVLADSYKKKCSAMELIKMFLQAGGNSLATLVEHVKDTKQLLPHTPQQIQSPQTQLPMPQQSALQLPQQIPRQMHPQLSQMVRPQNLTIQQQQQLQMELLRRRQASSPRPVMSMDKDRPMVQVKLENPPDVPMDSNTLSAMNSRQAQMQWRQEQLAALQRFGHQMKQPAMQIPQIHSPQIHSPQIHSPTMGAVRAQPVKVEGFSELMGGDTSLKQNSDESKLTSPSK